MTGINPVNPPLVSVLLPVYNAERYLRTALDSILNQTYPCFEAIVIDDGSTDASWNVIASYDDHRIRALRQENHGLPRTLNQGLYLSQGDLIARMDADDTTDPTRLQQQVEFLAAHPAVGLVGCGDRLMDESGQIIGIRQPLCNDLQLRRQLYSGNPFAHSGVMFRRSVVEATSGYRDLAGVEDYELWVRMSKETQLAQLPDPLVSIRLHDNSLRGQHRTRDAQATQQLRREIWSQAAPPSPWQPARTLSERFAALNHDARMLANAGPLPAHPRNRSRRELYTDTGIGIARHYWQSGQRRAALREYAALLWVNKTAPAQLARCLKHLALLIGQSRHEPTNV